MDEVFFNGNFHFALMSKTKKSMEFHQKQNEFHNNDKTIPKNTLNKKKGQRKKINEMMRLVEAYILATRGIALGLLMFN